MSDRLVVNQDTGEIENILQDGDRILKAKSIEHLSNKKKQFNKGKSFVKLYDEVVPDLVEYLNGAELKYILAISQHVSYSDCVLRKTSNNLSEPISASEFGQIHNYPYSTVKKVFNSLKKKGVLAYVEIGSVFPDYVGKVEKMYLVNPYIYFRGMEINETVKTIFDKSGWQEKLVSK